MGQLPGRISPEGRYISFLSGASNLVAGDTNNLVDVFYRDLWTGQVTLLSLSSGGAQGNDRVSFLVMSADARILRSPHRLPTWFPGTPTDERMCLCATAASSALLSPFSITSGIWPSPSRSRQCDRAGAAGYLHAGIIQYRAGACSGCGAHGHHPKRAERGQLPGLFWTGHHGHRHIPGYVWRVEDLAAGEGGVITVTGVLTTGLRGGWVITNTATITAATAEIVTMNISAPHSLQCFRCRPCWILSPI